MVLHGGPGSGSTAIHRRLFHPSHYRIVLLDQRGAGRSRPLGRLAGNTTDHLVGDIEGLREHLGIGQWLVFGASWGTTLALAYGIAHPEKCLGFILHAVFLPTKKWSHWMFRGLRRFFPEAWQAFEEHIPKEDRADLLGAYHARLMNEDPNVHLPALEAWSRYALATRSLTETGTGKLAEKTVEQILAMTRIEVHYLRNLCFLDVESLLGQLARISHLPVFITHGRCDLTCTPDHAYDLASRLERAELHFVDGAGHSYREPGNAAAIIRETEALRARMT